jgi:histidine decarboxylase
MTKTYLSPADEHALERLYTAISKDSQGMLGYPTATDFDYRELTPFFDYMLNNIGDPWVDSSYTLGTRHFEQEVIAFFADLFRAPAADYWGYVTNGGTESNLYALYAARERYPDATVYYSAATHYSIPKNVHLLRMHGIRVAALPSGEMDYDDLRTQLQHRTGQPAIVIANIGTTMTEARDNVATIKQALHGSGVQHYHIHSDAALSGIPSAFIDPHIPFDFADGADSISISGHKFIGAPLPCGVVLVAKSAHQLMGEAIAYVGTIDSTISGSRNAHGPLMLWYAIKRWGVAGLRSRTIASLELAAHAEQALQSIGSECWRNPNAMTVVFKTPSAEITAKWHLATADGWSHLICMPGTSKARIDTFVEDLRATTAAPSVVQPAKSHVRK